MKKIVLLAVLLSTSLFAGNLFSTISGMAMKEVKPEQAYSVDTAGLNPRVYTWTQNLVNGVKVQCIAMFPNSDGKHTAAIPTMQCLKL